MAPGSSIRKWDENMSTEDWPFAQPQDFPVTTVREVVDKELPITMVRHDDDGDWQFMAGTEAALEDIRLISLAEIVALDPTLPQLASMPMGHSAWWDMEKGEWIVGESPPEGEDASEEEDEGDWCGGRRIYNRRALLKGFALGAIAAGALFAFAMSVSLPPRGVAAAGALCAQLAVAGFIVGAWAESAKHTWSFQDWVLRYILVALGVSVVGMGAIMGGGS